MSKPVNKTAVGAFSVVFVLLLFVCVVAFGTFSFGSQSTRFVVYLEDSVNGLDIGSAVKFKGVKIGSVRRIHLNFTGQQPESLAVPVEIEIDGEFDGEDAETFQRDHLAGIIERGLRARVQLTSVVTGLLYVDLDFFPGTPAVFRGNRKIIDLPEIPTVQSNTAQLMKAVSTILGDVANADFASLSAQLKKTLERVDAGVSEIEFKKINDNVVRLTDSAATILEDPELKTTIANLNRLIAAVDALSQQVSAQVDPIARELQTSLVQLRATLTEISGAVRNFQNLLTPQQGGSIAMEVGDLLVQINDATRAVRALAEYLQENLVSERENPQFLNGPRSRANGEN